LDVCGREDLLIAGHPVIGVLLEKVLQPATRYAKQGGDLRHGGKRGHAASPHRTFEWARCGRRGIELLRPARTHAEKPESDKAQSAAASGFVKSRLSSGDRVSTASL